MPDTTLKLQFRSKAPDENLTLQDFAEQARDFQAALTALDQHISADSRATVAFPVIGLRHSSPSEVTIEAVGLEDSLEDNSARIIPAFVRATECLNAGQGFETLPRQVLEPLLRISKSLSEKMKEIKIAGAGTTVFVTERISELLANILETEKVTIGTIRGTLDIINVHKGANNFRLYPIIGASYVACNFPTELKDTAKRAIECYVAVTGKLHHRMGSDHPHLVEVLEIEIMPEESSLPTLASFHGIIKPDPGKSAEDLLEEERHGQWD
jgi:hypothetical protein